MSTKTTFKRIALATVAVMGFGLLSVAPASANTAGAFTTQSGLVHAGATDAGGGTVTAVATTLGDVSRATINTWTVPVSLAVTGTSLIATTGFAITGTVTSTAGTATSALSAVDAGVTINSATSATIVGTLTFTAATNTADANILAAAGTYVVTLSVAEDQDSAVAAAAANAVIGSPATGSFLAGTAYDGSRASLTQIVNGQATVVFVSGTADTSYTVTSSGVGTMLSATETTTAETLLGTTVAQGFTWAPGANVETQTILVTSATAGTTTLTFRPIGANGVPGTAVTATVTWIDAPTVSVAYSTAHIAQGAAAGTAATNILGATLVRTAGGQVANITVTLKDESDVAIAGRPLAATITGPGTIRMDDGNTTYSATNNGSRISSITAMADNIANIAVYADGTAGTGTITITSGTTTIATRTVTFFGAVATLTATQVTGVMRSGRTAASVEADFTLGGVDPALAAASAITRTTATNISIVAKDVDGNVVPLATNPTAVISDGLVIGAVNIAACTSASASTSVCAARAGNWIANTVSAIGGVSGASATVTFRTPHPTVANTFISSAALPFTLGGTATGGTVTMTLDKATYEPGERMIITYTAKDSAGNPVRDWTAVGAPSSSKAIVGLDGAGVYVAGKHVYGDGSTELTYAPTAPGPFTLTLATGTSTTATITATATVADDAATTAAAAAGDAAAEATDAANAATDAANAAAEAADAATAAAQDAADAVAALSTSVTAMVDSLRKQITSLTNLVIKIQRKVRA
jgi:trimeric autotransporter adhesin